MLLAPPASVLGLRLGADEVRHEETIQDLGSECLSSDVHHRVFTSEGRLASLYAERKTPRALLSLQVSQVTEFLPSPFYLRCAFLRAPPELFPEAFPLSHLELLDPRPLRRDCPNTLCPSPLPSRTTATDSTLWIPPLWPWRMLSPNRKVVTTRILSGSPPPGVRLTTGPHVCGTWARGGMGGEDDVLSLFHPTVSGVDWSEDGEMGNHHLGTQVL